MLSLNLGLCVVAFTFLGMGSVFQLLLFSTIPQQLTNIFNETFSEHYNVQLGEMGLSTVWSAVSFSDRIGLLIGILFVLPFMESKGRKFVVVYVRSFLSVSIALLQVFTYVIPSAEMYALSVFLGGILMPIKTTATLIYIAECSPKKHRGFCTTFIMVGDTLAMLIMFSLSRPSVFGNEHWAFIPFISVILAIALFLFTVWLPDSPKWLQTKNFEEKANESIKFFHGGRCEDTSDLQHPTPNRFTHSKKSYLEMWRDETVREAFFIVLSLSLLIDLSSYPMEGVFSVAMQNKVGLSAEQTMTLNTITNAVFIPFHIMGTVAIDKWGRRPIVFLAAAILYLKNILMIFAQGYAYFKQPSTFTVVLAVLNELLSGAFSATGVVAVSSLLITELVGAESRIAVAQLTSILSLLVTIPPFVCFPVLFNLFPPSFYIFFLFIQPFFVFYLYRKLPETANLSSEEILNNLDETVKSRSCTVQSTNITEKTPLLRES